ncbi:MAG TPA: hypothetical protein QF764_12495 [Planctomycetota bacterium]|nr:hypothetical protein [Planctomycetota bacterium]
MLGASLCLGLWATSPIASAQWDPGNAEWGKVAPEDVRVMTWNVHDTLCSSNTKVEGTNDWTALARIVAALRPDVLMLQECGDNSGNGTGSGVDSVPELLATVQLFFFGGTDPFNGGEVTAYVRKYAPDYNLTFRFVSTLTDNFNRNIILTNIPFSDLNGDGTSAYSDLPFIAADEYAPGGTGGIRGVQLLELNLPDSIYAGDLVVTNAHMKAGFEQSDHLQRVAAAQNTAYIIDYWYGGAGSFQPDPNGRISDNPPATNVLGPDTAVIMAGDWNEQEGSGGNKGPAGWISEAEDADPGASDGTDRDRSDSTVDNAEHFFTGDSDTLGNSKLDYIAWQDSIATQRLSFVFDTDGTPIGALPLEILGFPNPNAASGWAADHLPVIVDVILPQGCSDSVSYCVGAPNSAGSGANILSLGSTSVSINDLSLVAQAAVPSQFGLFYYGPQPAQVPFGDGFRCVGGGSTGTFRLNPPLMTDSFGDAIRALDMTQPPMGSGSGQVTGGSTWYFQFWYRDPQGPGGSGFNFSDGLQVDFCP